MNCSDWLKSTQSLLFDEQTAIAFAISKTGEAQLHVGVLCHTKKDDSYSLIHLAWHCWLQNQSKEEFESDNYYWVSTQIPRSIQANIRALCAKIWKRYSKDGIDYGFSSRSPSCFDLKSGEVRLGKDSSGLTCSTLILAVLASHNVQLVDFQTAPQRPDDQQWFDHIIAHLQNYKRATREHINKVQQSKEGAIRIRPEDVVCAGKHFDGTTSCDLNSLLDEIDNVREYILGQ
jgi:hypothetical protein